MANWWEGTNVRTIAYEFAKAFKAQGINFGGSGGGGGGDYSGGTSFKSQSVDKDTEAFEKHTRAVKTNEKSFIEHSQSLGKKIGGLVQGLTNILIKGRLVTQAAEDLSSSLLTGAESGTHFKRWAIDMARLGVPVKELNEFSKASRQAQIAMGGYTKWVDAVSDEQREFYKRLGDPTKALEFTTTVLEEFGHGGLRPSLDILRETTPNIGKWGNSISTSMDSLQNLGVSYEEQMQMFKEIMNDENVRHRLRAASSEKERKAILQGIWARNLEFKIAGMHTEQMKKASKALEELGGQKPLDRIRQAARAQAALTSMGVEGADEIGALLRKGTLRTPDDNKRLAEILGKAQDKLAESVKLGLPKELTYSILAGNSDLEELINKFGPFSTKLDENVQVSHDELATMKTLSTSTSAMEQLLINAGFQRERIENILNHHLAAMFVQDVLQVDKLSAILAGILGLTAIVGGKIVTVLWSLLKSPGKALDLIGDKVGGLFKGPKAAGIFKGAMQLLKGGVYTAAAGYGIQQTIQAITTKESDVSNLLQSTKGGQKISDAIGSTIANVMGFFGVESAKQAVEATKKSKLDEKTQEVQASLAREQQNALGASAAAVQQTTQETNKALQEQQKSLSAFGGVMSQTTQQNNQLLQDQQRLLTSYGAATQALLQQNNYLLQEQQKLLNTSGTTSQQTVQQTNQLLQEQQKLIKLNQVVPQQGVEHSQRILDEEIKLSKERYAKVTELNNNIVSRLEKMNETSRQEANTMTENTQKIFSSVDNKTQEQVTLQKEGNSILTTIADSIRLLEDQIRMQLGIPTTMEPRPLNVSE